MSAAAVRPLRNLLIANRGEIALRILRTAHALGYRVTAVYSEADAEAEHVRAADAALPIGPAHVRASYLNGAAVIEAARRAGADAVHPGYGLLSENAGFARACAQAGLVFIGPRPETIELMGDKRRARIAMRAAGVPCVPGYDGEDQSDEALAAQAARIGFPLLVKAVAGGGGRGMRRVGEAAQLPEAIARARSEAEHAFGDGRLLLERAIEGARHVELQVLADVHGHVVHLGERDCSVQRRFQKVIEEAPSPAVDAALRERMGEIAVLAARSSAYLGAGTVELLLAPSGEFYFLEMNTRLQVEHPVTELITGLDLVEQQLRIAEGQVLPLTQRELVLRGHAIEARLYAEVPERDFVPATGRVLGLSVPHAHGLRVDHALREGLVVGSHYDPLLAKLIAWGTDREQARRRLGAALGALRVLGVQTNQAFLRTLLEHPGFVAAELTTDFLDAQPAPAGAQEPDLPELAAAALAFVAHAQARAPYPAELAGHSNCVGLGWPLLLEHDERCFALSIEPGGEAGALTIHAGASRVAAQLLDATDTWLVARIEGLRQRFDHAWDGDVLWLHAARGARAFRDLTHAPPAASHAPGNGRALAPMDGSVLEVAVAVGDRVLRGQTLAVVEAMKLELRVPADTDGVVAAVHVRRGDQVKARQLLLELAASDEAVP